MIIGVVTGLCLAVWAALSLAGAETEESPVSIDGDEVEFSMAEKAFKAKGNVTLTYNDELTLTCDEVSYSQETGEARAQGNIVMTRRGRDDERFCGQEMTYNVETRTGEFLDANMMAAPLYGKGEQITKEEGNHLVVNRGYITTCDFDTPTYRLAAKKIDVYPGEKAVARNVRLLIGPFPILYIPKYTQDLRDKEPTVTLTPGYDKDWGAFLLSRWRYQLTDDLKGAVHLDYRQKKDFASGVDAEYRTEGYGFGVLRTYYMNERNTSRSHFFDDQETPTTERERFKVEWRHKWDIDDRTNAIWQYYRYSDVDFLKDYFKNEYDEDADPETYFLLTRLFPLGTLSLLTEARVNRFVDGVERLPQIGYDLFNTEIADTGLYVKNSTTFADLNKKPASPSDNNKDTLRLDTDNEVSYPFKLGFLEMKPFAGERMTYYSDTVDPAKDDAVRSIFRTGIDLSTKFYRVFDVNSDLWNLDINKLRHVLTPAISYLYIHEPTLLANELDQYDSVDALGREHKIVFSLENKLQTKRNDHSVDLVRLIMDTDFRLKEDPAKGGFNTVNADLEIRPYDWLSLYADSTYDTIAEHLQTANIDFYINDDDDRWYFKLGKRYHIDVDDQITTEWGRRLNQKWRVRAYERFDIDTGIMKEQEYTVERDLHAWLMEVTYNQTRGEGNEIWIVFTLKAFPDIGFDVNSSFHRRKEGSQTY